MGSGQFDEVHSFSNERARRNEISETTISNYYKATKLFCEMNNLSLG
jgi:hypothetical protein